jgi:hypothetical protein
VHQHLAFTDEYEVGELTRSINKARYELDKGLSGPDMAPAGDVIGPMIGGGPTFRGACKAIKWITTLL